MKIRLDVVKNNNQLLGLPKCKKSKLLCKCLGQSFLFGSQVKRLQLMGYEIFTQNVASKKNIYKNYSN